MKQSLFRYIPEEYVESFIKRGEILFRPLSYYRDFEGKNVRRDEYEGTKLVPLGVQRNIQTSSYSEQRIKLGKLSKICKIHHF